MVISGQEAQYDPISDANDGDDEASDYKLPAEPAPLDYALHPLKSTESFFVKLIRHYG